MFPSTDSSRSAHVTSHAAAAWAVSATFFVTFLLAANMQAVREVEVGFIATAAILSSLLYVAYRRPVRVTEARLRPGSGEEIEAVLAAADEGS